LKLWAPGRRFYCSIATSAVCHWKKAQRL